MFDDQRFDPADDQVQSPAAWWDEVLESVGTETRARLEGAAADLEGAGCPRVVWAQALKEYLERTPLPTEQWLGHAATFERLAQQLEDFEEQYAWAADTRYIVGDAAEYEIDPFATDLPSFPSLQEHAAALRQHAAAYRRQAERQGNRRSAGQPDARQRLVDDVQAHTLDKSPTTALAVMLSILGSETVTAEALNMARSRRGRAVKRSIKPSKKRERTTQPSASLPSGPEPPKPRLIKKPTI